MGKSRKVPLVEGEVYHICSKSIADFRIFKKYEECRRMKDLLSYYQTEKPPVKYSDYIKIKDENRIHVSDRSLANKLVEIIAYCIMPTHLHLILKQLKEKGISVFMKKILDSYSRYFNIKTDRKGPLWEGRFKNVLMETDEQLLHTTRYIHLNPSTARLVDRPKDWEFSSYKEFLGKEENGKKICKFSELLDIDPKSYKEFVESRINYQRELAHLKASFID